ncbi:MAG: radical SAM family heme chaperone HemW [Spirochaetes bacterium]|nr:radical SAM family heme chaperone HemW [Spirochaetota bacterium]
MKPSVEHIYIHFPFCQAKCHYCSFYSRPYQPNLANQYLYSLEKEISQSNEFYDFSRIKTIYIGGGTPNISLPNLFSINQILTKTFNLDSIKEYTVECNTSILTENFIHFIEKTQCNRLSLGIQSCNPQVLKQCNRQQTNNHDFFSTLNNFLNIKRLTLACDFINGLPGQDYLEELNYIDKLLENYPNINHLSLYDFSIESNSYFYHDSPDLIDSDLLSAFEAGLKDLLKQHQFSQYEVSNYARAGYESLHNLAYWNYQNYIGFGPAAHSTIENQRLENKPDIESYIKSSNYQTQSELTKPEMIKEFLLMGLRLNKGIKLRDFQKRFGYAIEELIQNTLDKYASKNQLSVTTDTLATTKKGINYLNSILIDIFIELDKREF